MKSLEIVRDKLYILEKYPAKIETVKLEKDVLINQEQLLKIEQDLEVLEIIKKILFNRYVISDFDGFDSTMENPIYYLELEDYDKEHPVFLLEQEEKDKLKQWLEVNENDR